MLTSRSCGSTLFGIFVKNTVNQRGVQNMNFKFLLLPMRSLSTLIAILGFQQMLFGHHAEVMKGNTFIQGLSMPLHGLDHMLMAIGIGIVAVQLGGRYLWVVTSGFLGVLLVSGFFNLSGISITLLELMIIASLILVSAQLIIKHDLPAGIIAILFPVLGVVHGQVLVQKLLTGYSLEKNLMFAIGCAFSILLLLFLGLGIGFLFKKMPQEDKMFSWAGATFLMATLLVVLVPGSNSWLVGIFEVL